MLLFAPFLVFLAIATSVITFLMLVAAGDLNLRAAIVLGLLIVLAGYAQFFSGSVLVAAAGLGLQTLLAVFLLIRWRLGR